jgi:hypothetical protein
MTGCVALCNAYWRQAEGRDVVKKLVEIS